MIAVVPGDVNGALGSSKEKPLAFRIFAHGVYRFVIRQTGGDFLPRLATVVRAVDVRMQVIQAEAVDGGISRDNVEM